MTAIPFCGSSYSDKTPNANAQECINLYPVLSPTPYDPKRIILYPTPGYRLLVKLADRIAAQTPGFIGTEIRAQFVVNSTMYVVCGNILVSFVDIGTGYTVHGMLGSNSGKVSIACNSVELAISDDSAGYVLNLSTGVFSTISGGSFPSSGGVRNFTCMDDYTLAALNDSKQVIQSNLLDAGTFGAQAYVQVDTFPDNIVAVYSDKLQLYIFGPKVTEVRFNAASTPFAFEKVQGVLIPAGCAAKNTITKLGNSIAWLAADEAGKAFVATLEGYSPKPISHAPLNEAMERYATVSDAFAYSYREGDNQFYVITFPSAGKTWAMDLKTGWWHERSYNDGADLPLTYANWQGKHIVGDSAGRLWYMSQDFSQADFGGYYTGGASQSVPDAYPPKRIRSGAHIEAEGRMIFLQEIEFFLETGVGLNNPNADANLSTSISDPLATLQISRDGCHTWVTIGTKPLGKIGEYRYRVIWRGAGKGRHLTPRLIITDPVRVYILGCRARFVVGTK